MKKTFLLLPIILGLVYVITTGYSSGYAASTTGDRSGADGSTGCGGCHSTSATTGIGVTVTLDSAGTTITHYTPGHSYNIKLVGVNNLSASTSLPGFGFILSAVKLAGSGTSSAADLGTFGSSLPTFCQSSTITSSSRTVIEHSRRISASTGSGAGAGATTYSELIPWTAPSAGSGSVKLFLVINAVNADGSASSADKWNNTTDTVYESTYGTIAPITGTDTVCVGATTTLRDASTGGTWSSVVTSIATISSGGVVYGVAPGETIISYTSSAGTATTTVTVLAATTAGTISGSSSVCAGSTTAFTDAATGGSWSSGSSGVATVSASGVVTGVSVGTSIITYTVTGPCGTARATKTISVTAGASAGTISGASTVCPHDSITLTETVTGGTWTSSNTALATVSGTGKVFGVAAGTLNISYSVTTSCGTAVAIHAVTVIPSTNPGTISGFSFICTSTSISLSETVTGGTWSITNTSLATINSSGTVFAGSTSGLDTVKYSVTGSCGTAVATYVVTIGSTAARAAGYLRGMDSVCVGSSIALTDSAGAVGGTWSSSATSIATVDATGHVTGVSSGTTTITYIIRSSTCGSDTATKNVKVIYGVPTITGTLFTCVGATDSLHNAVSGGLWASSNPSIAAAAAGFGTVMGVSAGTVTISYTAASGCRTTIPFTVYPIPAAITGVMHTCPGLTTSLADATSGGSWTAQDTTMAKVSATGVVTGITASTTTITYTIPSHGCHVTTTVVVNPIPAFITGQDAICSTLTDTLHDLTAGGTFSSSTGSIAVVDGTTGVVTGVGSGIDNITYTLPTGCYVTKTVTVHPLPNPTIFFNWVSNTFSVGNYYTSYKWYLNGVVIPGAVTYNCAAFVNGTYTVFVTDTFGCENLSTAYVLTNLGVEQVNSASAITIHPNPTTGNLIIDAPVMVNAVVTGLEGRVVMEQKNAKTMDISSLPSGIYMMLLFDENGNKLAVQKIVKQ